MPAATTGHSSGEIAAAYASGGLTFREAVAIAYIRGRLTSDFVDSGRARGGMTAIAASKETVEEYFKMAEVSSTAVIACVNSPNSVTISGEIPSLEKVEVLAGNEDVLFRRLKVPAAYHSTEMEALADDYLNGLKCHFEDAHLDKFGATFSSPVTGGIVESTSTVRDPGHWVKNMVQPVLFDDSLSAMISGQQYVSGKPAVAKVDLLIEIGPHGTLQGPMKQILDGMGLQSLKTNVTTCLKRGEDASKTVKELAMMLHCKGYAVDLDKVNFPRKAGSFQVVHDLPTYQWNHSVGYWDVPQSAIDYMQRRNAHHDLLGVRIEGLNPEQAIWRNTIRISDLPWLQHHVVQSEILYPAAGLLVMVTEAMRQLDLEAGRTIAGYSLDDVDLSKAVIIPSSGEALEIQLVIKEASTILSSDLSSRTFVFYSRFKSGPWNKHCQGTVIPASPQERSTPAGGLELVPMDVGHFYKVVETSGPTLGPTFRNITRVCGGGLSAEATIVIPDVPSMMPSQHASACLVHPTVLDACFHPAWAALPDALLRKLGLSVPRTIKSLFIGANISTTPGAELGVRVQLKEASQESFEVSISIYSLEDAERIPVIQIDGLRMVSIADNQDTSPIDELMLLHTLWEPSLGFQSPTDLQARIIESPDSAEAVVFDDLQQATINVIHDALQQLSPDDEEKLDWYHKKYVAWMRDQDATFYDTMAIQGEHEKLELYSRVTSSSVNGRMLDLVGRHLLSFLKKEEDPLEVMGIDGFLSEYYANMIRLTRCLNHVEEYMKLFAHENPGARILEIGAGTGSCTEPALRGLSQNGQAHLLAEKYVFTDVSAGFFEAAQKRFETFAGQIHFQKLNIERDPLEQGFDEGDYDLVISCNCLHATANLQHTLTNVRKLLKPGGKLVLLETTTPHVDQSLTFGLFSGWWLSEEEERKNSPLLSAPAWSRYLGNSGFSGVDVALGDAGSAEVSNYSAMVATAVDPALLDPVEGTNDVTVVTFPSVEGLPREWLEDLISGLGGIAGKPVAIIEDIKSISAIDAVVCLLVTDRDALASVTPETLGFLKDVLLESNKVLWISRGAAVDSEQPGAALHTGLLRTLRMEQGENKYLSLDLDPSREFCTAESVKTICRVYSSIAKSPGLPECELVERDGTILVPRLRKNVLLMQELEASLEFTAVGRNSVSILVSRHDTRLILFEQKSMIQTNLDLRPDAGYVVIGGLTGVGREVVRFLARRGAKNIILLSRTADVTTASELQLEFSDVGTKVIPYACDVANKQELEKFIGVLKIIMPIRGVIQSALVLEDASFSNMTSSQWDVPLGPKYHGSKNLDELFQSPELDFFIMLSSVTGILGSHGQSNYTAGSTYQDALARNRVARGLPGTSIDLGSVLGAGYVARTTGVAERAAKLGWRAHTIHEVLRMIEAAIRNPHQAEIVAGVAPWSEPGPLTWRQERRFAALPLRIESSKVAQKDASTTSLRDRLQAAPAEAKVDTMVEGLTDRLAEMFVLSPSDINQSQPLGVLGVDSLVAVELRNWVSANVTPSVTIFDVTQSGSLVELAEKLVKKLP